MRLYLAFDVGDVHIVEAILDSSVAVNLPQTSGDRILMR